MSDDAIEVPQNPPAPVVTYTTVPVPMFHELTKSPVVASILSQFDASNRVTREALVYPFSGDHDAAHQKTRSWRKSLARLGFTLHYKNNRDQNCLILWIVPFRDDHALAVTPKPD